MCLFITTWVTLLVFVIILYRGSVHDVEIFFRTCHLYGRGGPIRDNSEHRCPLFQLHRMEEDGGDSGRSEQKDVRGGVKDMASVAFAAVFRR